MSIHLDAGGDQAGKPVCNIELHERVVDEIHYVDCVLCRKLFWEATAAGQSMPKLFRQIVMHLRAAYPCCSCCDGNLSYVEEVITPIEKMIEGAGIDLTDLPRRK